MQEKDISVLKETLEEYLQTRTTYKEASTTDNIQFIGKLGLVFFWLNDEKADSRFSISIDNPIVQLSRIEEKKLNIKIQHQGNSSVLKLKDFTKTRGNRNNFGGTIRGTKQLVILSFDVNENGEINKNLG